MNVGELDELLMNLFQISPKNIERYDFTVHNLSALKLRDILIRIGHICQENIDKHEYVATMGGGFLKLNVVFLALMIDEGKLHVSISAKEGLFSQHTCKGAIDELKRELAEFIEEK